MATTYYDTVNGRLRGEVTSGARTGYLTDALGSVTATVQSAAVVNTYRYKPYGERLTKTGAGADPKFGHTGDTGSRLQGMRFADHYNTHRHRDGILAQWSSLDPLWPSEPPYGYVGGNPTSFIDPLGLSRDPCAHSIVDEIGHAACDLMGAIGSPCSFVLPICERHCQAQGTAVRECIEVSTLGGYCAFSMCCRCYCECDDLNNGGLCPPGMTSHECALQEMAKWVYPAKRNGRCKVGKAHKNSGDRAQCGKHSLGRHYMYHCEDVSGLPTKPKSVISSKCCLCYKNGKARWKCSTTRGCHAGSHTLPC